MAKSLVEMLMDLLYLDNEIWGLYSFSKDILRDKISQEDMVAWAMEAKNCAEHYAQKIMEKYHTRDAITIAMKMGLDIQIDHSDQEKYWCHDSNNQGYNFQSKFALFIPPQKIILMEDPIKKSKSTFNLLKRESSRLILTNKKGKLVDKRDIANILLANEIYHYMEGIYEEAIYSRKKKFILYTIPIVKYKFKLPIRALSKMGAMAFSWWLNDLSFSPYLLDVFLTYGYHPDTSERIYDEIMMQKQNIT
jgi:hypothetical protein